MYQCRKCRKYFKFQQDLTTHMSRDHGELEQTHRMRQHGDSHHSEQLELGHHRVLDSDSDWEDEDKALLKVKKLKEAILPLSERRRLWPALRESLDYENTDWLLSSGRRFRGRFSQLWEDLTSVVERFALSNHLLKRVEGQFGSGVYHFFKFFKWSLGLNLVLTLLTVLLITVPEHFLSHPEPLCDISNFNNSQLFLKEEAETCCSVLYNKNQEWKKDQLHFASNIEFFKDLGIFLLHLVQGDGWMESTYLYYGKYSQDHRSYQMAVAYFFVIFCCFAFSLISLVIHSAKYIKQGFKFHEQNSNQYFTLVYCYWDFSVNSETSAKIKLSGFINHMRTALSTDSIQNKFLQMKLVTRLSLYCKRALAWLLVLGSIGGYIFSIIKLLEFSENTKTDQACTSFDSITVDIESITAAASCYIKVYSTTLTITAANLILPFLFSLIVVREEYSPKTQLMVDLSRSITIRLSGLIVILVSSIRTNRCWYYQETRVTQTFMACDNTNFMEAGALCSRKICWETTVGVEFYRLTMFDLISQALVIICIDIIRVKCCSSAIEFNVPKHVLDIVYSQSICWMGLFFAPLLSGVTLVKLFIVFYLRIIYLNYLCRPSKTLYEASRTSSMLNYFLLFSFLVSFIPLAYILGDMNPSNSCGPFKASSEEHFYTGLVYGLISEWQSATGQSIILFLGRTSVLMASTAVVLLLTYFTYLRYAALAQYNSRIKHQLRSVSEETKTLKRKMETCFNSKL